MKPGCDYRPLPQAWHVATLRWRRTGCSRRAPGGSAAGSSCSIAALASLQEVRRRVLVGEHPRAAIPVRLVVDVLGDPAQGEAVGFEALAVEALGARQHVLLRDRLEIAGEDETVAGIELVVAYPAEGAFDCRCFVVVVLVAVVGVDDVHTGG